MEVSLFSRWILVLFAGLSSLEWPLKRLSVCVFSLTRRFLHQVWTHRNLSDVSTRIGSMFSPSHRFSPIGSMHVWYIYRHFPYKSTIHVGINIPVPWILWQTGFKQSCICSTRNHWCFSKVTVALVEEYIKPLEMVILCVIPAMSDFGNAEALLKRGWKKERKPIWDWLND